MTKARKMLCVLHQIQEVLRQKSKSFTIEKERLRLLLQPESDHQESKRPFQDFRWIGPYLVENDQPNNNYFVRKFNTNKTQILHRIRLRKYNPETPPEDNDQEVLLQIEDNIINPQDGIYITAWEAEFGGHLFDIPILYTDPNAIDFDESYK